jgi:hypothetical protein
MAVAAYGWLWPVRGSQVLSEAVGASQRRCWSDATLMVGLGASWCMLVALWWCFGRCQASSGGGEEERATGLVKNMWQAWC